MPSAQDREADACPAPLVIPLPAPKSFGLWSGNHRGDSMKQKIIASAVLAASLSALAACEKAEPSLWTYAVDKDQMRGTEDVHAYLKSPSGDGYIKLTRYSTDEISGTMVLDTLSQCFDGGYINVKFDEGKIEKIACHNAKNIVLQKSDINKIMKSKKFIVEAKNPFKNASQIIYDSQGLYL